MLLPNLYLSRPATVIPDGAVDNDATLARVRESSRCPANEWDTIEQAIRWVFDRCNTKMRYFELDKTVSPGQFAARAAAACLAENGMAATDVDLLIYGGVARDAFEPATAAEVAGRLGAAPLHALDVTCACAGLIEALHVAAGYFALHDELQTALICAGELSGDWINYNMESVDDVLLGVAGLTIGNAAGAYLVTRNRLPEGGARLVGIKHKTLSEHFELCRTPVDGHFSSRSNDLFMLGAHVPPEIRILLKGAGWTPEEVNHYAFHQPSEAALEWLFSDLGARPQAGVHTHSMFGNTASTSWVVALDYRLRNGTVENGDKIVIGSAAAGFTMASAAAVWEC